MARVAAGYRMAALGLLLAAWALLLYRLNAVPPGFQHDQTFNTLDALEALGGKLRLYYPTNFGREPLGILLAALGLRIAGGFHVWGLRFGTVIAGMLALAVACSLSRRYLSHGAALLATGLLAGSFWFLFTARLGLEPMLVASLASGMIYFLHRCVSRGSRRDVVAAGLLGAAAVHTYLAGRALFLLAPMLLAHELVAWCLAARHRNVSVAASRRSNARRLALSWLVMAAASAPLLWYVRGHAAADQRLNELGGPLTAAARGDLRPLFDKAAEAAASILWAGSTAIPYHYNLPGRPALQPALAVLFLLGLAGAVWFWVCGPRERRAGEFLLLAALLLGMAPVMLSGADALHMRGVIALPLLFLIVARGAEIVARTAKRLFGWESSAAPTWARAVAIALGMALLAAQWLTAGRAYFDLWATAEPTLRIYNADFRAAAAYLTMRPGLEPAFIGTDRQLDLDRQTYLLYGPARRDARWFHLPGNPPMPRAGSAWYLLPGESAPLPPALALLRPGATTDEALPGAGGAYDLLRVLRLPADAVDALLAERGARPPDAIPTYGETLRLTSAAMQEVGSALDIITEWEAIGPWPFQPPPGEAPTPPKLAGSLYDAAGYRWAQVDVPAAMPYRTWQPGDRLLEQLSLPVPGDIPPGEYEVRLAVYDDRGGVLPVRLGDAAAADVDAMIGRVQLTGNTPRGIAPEPPHPAEMTSGGNRLRALGVWEAPEMLIAGVPADVHVSWRAGSAPLPTAGLHFRLMASDPQGRPLWEQSADPAQPLPEPWPAGQVYRLTHRLEPQMSQPGETDAVLELCAEDGGETLACVVLGRPRVINRPPVTALPAPPQTASGATWDDRLTLAGYDLTREGEALLLTLYWHVEQTPDRTLKRFVHAVDAEGAIVAQADGAPAYDGRPMTNWRPGEYVVDRVVLDAAGSAAAELRIGWYDPVTGARLPARDAAGALLPESFLPASIP